MPRLRGRAEVARRKQIVDESFNRAGQIPQGDLQLVSDFGRYLTILVTGYLEKSLQELAIQCVRNQSSPRIQNYVESQIGRLINVNSDRILQVVGSFDASWRKDLETNFADELITVNSLYANRHPIAHGDSVGVTVNTAREHYDEVASLVNKLVELFDP
jgi:RiboL-PSP-HEPN